MPRLLGRVNCVIPPILGVAALLLVKRRAIVYFPLFLAFGLAALIQGDAGHSRIFSDPIF